MSIFSTIAPVNEEQPFIPMDVLPEKPEERQQILDNDELYNLGAQKWKESLETVKSEDAKPEEIKEEVAPPVTDEVVPPIGDQPPVESVSVETAESLEKDAHNPFYTMGITDDLYDEFVAVGKIKDGRLNSTFTPEDKEKFWKHYLNTEKLRGQQSNQLGEQRQESVKLKEKINHLERTIQKIKDEDFDTVDTSTYFIEDGNYPKALLDSEVEGTGVVGFAKRQVKQKFEDTFQNKGVVFPTTKEDWEEFSANPSNSALYSAVQSAYQKELRNGILILKETERHLNMKPAKEELLPLKASELLLDAFVARGVDFSPDDSEYQKIFNKISDEIYDKHQKDPLYFEQDIFTKEWYLRADAFANFAKINNIVPEKKVESQPAQDTGIANERQLSESVKTSLLDFEQQLRTAGVDLNIGKLPKDSEDYKILHESVKELFSNLYYNNPVFFDEKGLKKDGFAKFFFANHWDYVPSKLKGKYDLDKQKAVDEAAQKATEFYSARVPKTTDFTSSLAGKIEGTTSGADRPIPPPEIFNNPVDMLKWIKDNHYASSDDAYAVLEPVIKQRGDRQLYGYA